MERISRVITKTTADIAEVLPDGTLSSKKIDIFSRVDQSKVIEVLEKKYGRRINGVCVGVRYSTARFSMSIEDFVLNSDSCELIPERS